MPGVKRKKASLERKRSYAGYLFILPFIIGLFVIFLPMIIQLFLMSFSVFNSADSTFSYGAAGFGYYKEIFTKDSWFLQLYTSTISKSLIDSVCILLFSYFVAILLKQKFSFRKIRLLYKTEHSRISFKIIQKSNKFISCIP